MSLKSRLAADETLFTDWSGVPDALTVEIIAKQGVKMVADLTKASNDVLAAVHAAATAA